MLGGFLLALLALRAQLAQALLLGARLGLESGDTLAGAGVGRFGPGTRRVEFADTRFLHAHRSLQFLRVCIGSAPSHGAFVLQGRDVDWKFEFMPRALERDRAEALKRTHA